MLRESRRIAGGFAWTLAVAVAWIVFGPSRAEAQDCVACTDLRAHGQVGHIAQDSPFGIHARAGGTHPNKLAAGFCLDKHPITCGPGGGGGGVLYDQPGRVLGAVLAAVSAGDALEAYRIVLRQPKESPVHFVPERTAIQVRGCSELVIAHIPLAHLATAELLAAVAVGRRAHSEP